MNEVELTDIIFNLFKMRLQGQLKHVEDLRIYNIHESEIKITILEQGESEPKSFFVSIQEA